MICGEGSGVTVELRPSQQSARDVAPDDVAPARPPLPPFLDHALFLSRHEIEQGIAAHVHEAMRLQQRLDVLPRPAAEEGQLVADRRVLLARAGILRRRWRGASIELPVHDDQAPPGRRTRIHSSIAASGCESFQSR
jgi:hypothetical protein